MLYNIRYKMRIMVVWYCVQELQLCVSELQLTKNHVKWAELNQYTCNRTQRITAMRTRRKEVIKKSSWIRSSSTSSLKIYWTKIQTQHFCFGTHLSCTQRSKTSSASTKNSTQTQTLSNISHISFEIHPISQVWHVKMLITRHEYCTGVLWTVYFNICKTIQPKKMCLV